MFYGRIFFLGVLLTLIPAHTLSAGLILGVGNTHGSDDLESHPELAGDRTVYGLALDSWITVSGTPVCPNVCAGTGGHSQAAANGDNGSLKVYASHGADAGAGFQDTFTPILGTLPFTFRLGYAVSSVGGLSDSYSAGIHFQVQVEVEGDPGTFQWLPIVDFSYARLKNSGEERSDYWTLNLPDGTQLFGDYHPDDYYISGLLEDLNLMDSVLLGGTAGPIELRIILSASAYGEATVDSYNTLWVETAALSGSGYNYLGEPQSGEVPEPSTFLLLASGLAAGALFHRRTTGKK